MSAHFALGLKLLLLNAARESVERSRFAMRNPRFGVDKFRDGAKGRRIACRIFLLLASLLLFRSAASATGAGPGVVLTQSSADSSSAGKADNDVHELEVGKPIERDLAGGQHPLIG
jgi:hypothetical protein